jgi:diguanylate cyclase (GGDEF)-like protein
MESSISFLANGLTIGGVCILIAALVPIYLLFKKFPMGRIRSRWYLLTALIFFFIAGYLVYTVTHWHSHLAFSNLVVPAIFFFGACFVLLVNILSLQTAVDIRHMAVMEHENMTDSLTGLFNRRYMEQRMKEEVTRALRYDLPLSLLMLDIDHFKKINDTCGHQAGDKVLQNLGKLILNAVRESDIAVRCGGEEIMVITPHTKAEVAGSLAERLRSTVESADLLEAGGNNSPGSVTVSIGVAQLGGGTGQELIKKADEAMYRAKQEGRNRVVTSNQ